MAESQLQQPPPMASASSGSSPPETTRRNSLANSDETDSTVVARERPNTVDSALYRRAALLSTNFGQRPAREPPGPPFPRVIVRSNLVTGVVELANYWRNKHPYIYHSVFPDSGWTITDLWDNADIHLDSPGFLERVLVFICRDNAYRANAYVDGWIKTHPEKLEMIGGDMSQVYDMKDPAAIVNKIFTDGETELYPPAFLWHVFRNIRMYISIAMGRIQAAKTMADTQGLVDAAGESTGTTTSASGPTGKSDITQRVKQTKPKPSPGLEPYSQQQTHLPYVTSNITASTTSAQPELNGMSSRGPSYSSSQSGRVYPNQATGYPAGQHAAPIPLPYANTQLRDFKNRSTRSASNPYFASPQTHGWGNNTSIPPEQQQTRKLLAHNAPGQSPHLVQHMPAGPSEPLAFNNHLPHAQMYPAQAQFPSAMQQNTMPPHAMPLVPHPMGTVYGPQPGPSGSVPGAMPFGDMTNNLQYPPSRNIDAHGPMLRRPSYANKASRLYDPYGAERPDKAGFTNIPSRVNVGKGRQNNFLNGYGGPRKHSASFGNHKDTQHMRAPYNQAGQELHSGSDYGCSKNHIGWNNTMVTELHVTNMPEDVTEEELSDFFLQQSKVMPIRVEMKSNMSVTSVHNAFVHFSSTADARQGLRANHGLLRGKALMVSVPKRFYQSPEVPATFMRKQTSNSYSRGHNSMSSYNAHSLTGDDTTDTQAVQYSPQDARSDLRQTSHQPKHQIGAHEMADVPKRETQVQEGASHVSKSEQQAGIEVIKHTADQLSVVNEQTDPVESLASQQVITDVLKDVESSTGPETEAANSGGSSTLEAETVADRPFVASSDLEAITEERGMDSARSGIPKSNSLEDSPFMGESEARIHALNQSSPPDDQTATVKPPPIEDVYSIAGDTVPDSQAMAAEEGNTTHNESKDTTTTVRSPEDTTSDDDQKNDLSFHSAQESQSDTGKNERRSELDSLMATGEAPPTPGNSNTGSLTPQHTESKSIDEKIDLAEHRTVTPQKVESKEPATTVEKPSVDAAKKSGVKQTQSLFPFAKPSKTQTKKEKQAKRKDKKKDKEKGKIEKAAPATTVTKGPITVDSNSSTSGPAPAQEVSPAHPNVAEETSDLKNLPEDNVKTKEESKGTKAVPRDVTPNTLREAQDEAKKESQGPESQHSRGASEGLQSLHGDGSKRKIRASSSGEIAGVTSLPQSESATMEQHHPKDNGQRAKKTKQTPPMIAVPKMDDLLKFRPSNKATLTESVSLKKTSQAQDTDDESASVVPASNDVASVGSSPTVRAESPPPISPSPTASGFFTPAQTPSDFHARPSAIGPPWSGAVGSSPNEPARKKKSKKKKKSGLIAVGTANSVPTANDKAKEPFADQLHEIDGIKSGNTSGGQHMRSVQGAAKDGSRSEDKDSRNLFRTVHDYVKEKVDTYARLPETTWPADRRRMRERMMPEVFEETMHREDEPIIPRVLVRDSLLTEEDVRKIKKAGTEALFRE